MTLRRVFLFEYLSAGGDDVPAGLRAEGMAMRDALHSDLLAVAGWSVSVAVGPQDPRALHTPHADGARCPDDSGWNWRRAGESIVDFVAREAACHDRVWVVAPETGGVLASLCDVVPPLRWIGCDAESIRLSSSKRATLDRLHSHGVTTPWAFIDDPSVNAWVVKPDDGAGSVDTHRHTRRAEAQADLAQRRRATATLEPWVDGEAMSLSLLVGTGSTAELLAVNRQQVVVDPLGSVSLEGVEINLPIDAARRAALARIGNAVCSAIPGLAGIVGIDLVWHATRGPVVIEVNPRVTSAYVGLAASLGRQLAAEVMALSPTVQPAQVNSQNIDHGQR